MSTTPLTPAEPPYAEEHAALVADLAATLDLQTGLDCILGRPGRQAQKQPTVIASLPSEFGRYHAGHADLVADLTTTLRLPVGVADILDTAGAHAGLLTDLTAALNIQRGLASILTPMPTPTAEPPPPDERVPTRQAAAERTAPTSLPVPRPELTDQLAAIRALADHDRLLLRTGDRHRELHRAIRALEDLDTALGSMPHGTDRRAARLHNTLRQQHQHLDATLTVLAGTAFSGPAPTELHRPGDAFNATPLGQRSAGVLSVAIAPDGSWLATGGDDGVVRMWDATAGQLRAELAGHTGTVRSAPDGSRPATGGDDGAVTTGRQDKLPPPTRMVWSVAIAPDGSWLATGGNDGVRMWDTATGQLRTELTDHARMVRSVAIAPDGSWLATVGNDGVRMWDAATGQLRAELAGHTGTVRSVAIAPDGSWLATVGNEGVRVWDAATGRLRTELTNRTGTVQSVAIAPDGSWLATGGNDGVRMWDAATGQLRTELTGHTATVRSVAIAPDGSWLATGGNDGVRMWDATTGQLRAELTGHTATVRSVAIAPDGSWLATGDDDGAVGVWDATTGQLRAELTGHTATVQSVAIAPDGSWLATGGADDAVPMWPGATSQGRAHRDGASSDLAGVTSQLRHLADQLRQAEDQLRHLTRAGMAAGVRAACRHLVAVMSDQASQVWAALSEFQGTDLHTITNVDIDDLDGVLWSDATADGGPTVWPDELRPVVEEHSVLADTGSGVFIVQFGTVIGTGPACGV
ncbi:WD40 repeat domain-containing protein [Dactylosporangium sp. NPDC048998]|uniref:WD40 repeat domain-containing protein n=1 Tax=Dactylosporangium sp. NPDC048998 TaxID=3363976 RepID=UPI003711B64A